MFRNEVLFSVAAWQPGAVTTGALTDMWSEEEICVKRLTHPLGHAIQLRLGVSDTHLEFSGEIRQPNSFDRTRLVTRPEWYFADHVVLYLDPFHDHTTQRMVALTKTGEVIVEDGDKWFLNGEIVSDITARTIDLPGLEPEVETADVDGIWCFRMRFEIARLGGRERVEYPNRPLGVAAYVGLNGEVQHAAVGWPEPHPFWKRSPINFADVLPPDARVHVHTLDFGRPHWQVATADTASLRLLAEGIAKPLTSGQARVSITDTIGNVTTTSHAWTSCGNQLELKCPVVYPFTAKWAPDEFKIARISISLADEMGEELWAGSYPFGFDAGIIVRESFSQSRVSRPLSDDPNFVTEYRAWLLGVLPDWELRTTKTGAPSDFYLYSENSQHCIDLMAADVFGDLARLIYGLADDWQDALCLASMLLHHPLLTVHSLTWSRVSANSEATTVLRLGGCFCSEGARVGGHLAEALGVCYRVKLTGFTLGLRGHVTTLVESPLGDVLFDPMLGIYYHTPDNTRLATVAEMREEREITERMWSLPFAHGHEFFYQTYTQNKEPLAQGVTQIPPVR